VLGLEHAETLASRSGLASAPCQQGKYAEAEVYLRAVLQIGGETARPNRLVIGVVGRLLLVIVVIVPGSEWVIPPPIRACVPISATVVRATIPTASAAVGECSLIDRQHSMNRRGLQNCTTAAMMKSRSMKSRESRFKACYLNSEKKKPFN